MKSSFILLFSFLIGCSSNVIQTKELKCELKDITEHRSPKSHHYIGVFNCPNNKEIEISLDKKQLEIKKLKSKQFYIRTQTVKTCLFGICYLFDCNGLEE